MPAPRPSPSPTPASTSDSSTSATPIGATDSAPTTDVLEACRNGDAEAWQQLVGRYERLIYAIPLRMGLSRDDADEIFQLTFTALFDSLDAIRDAERLGGWLATVAQRHSWRLIKRAKASLPLDEDAGEWLAEANHALREDRDPLSAVELSLWLDKGLAALAERCRQLLLALYFRADEPSYADVAVALQIPVGSVGPTRARCLERLRELLGPT